MFDSYGDFLLPGLRSKSVLLLRRTNQMGYFTWRFANLSDADMHRTCVPHAEISLQLAARILSSRQRAGEE